MLTTLGIASCVFVAWFTWQASCRASIYEAWLNLLVGLSVNFLANTMLLPLVGASFTAGENFWLGCIYTAVSIVRQYCIRRWFMRRVF
jgi:hypothetical protein